MEPSLIPADWPVSTDLRERFGERSARQQYLADGQGFLLYIHEVPEPGIPERQGIVFLRQQDGAWKCTRGTGDKAELGRLLDRYAQRIDSLEASLEDCSGPRTYYDTLRTVTPLLRSLKNLSGVLQLARDAHPRLKDVILWRDRAAELERAAELLMAEAKLGLDYAQAEAAEQQSEASLQLARSGHRLNLLVAFFLPMTALAAAFGMNLDSGLPADRSPFFWGILASGFLLGLLLLRRLR